MLLIDCHCPRDSKVKSKSEEQLNQNVILKPWGFTNRRNHSVNSLKGEENHQEITFGWKHKSDSSQTLSMGNKKLMQGLLHKSLKNWSQASVYIQFIWIRFMCFSQITINNRHRLSRDASQETSVFIHPESDVYWKVKLPTKVKSFFFSILSSSCDLAMKFPKLLSKTLNEENTVLDDFPAVVWL